MPARKFRRLRGHDRRRRRVGARVDLDSDSISAQFPEIAISRRSGHIVGEGKINGGGPKLMIRSSSGVVTIRKGRAV